MERAKLTRLPLARGRPPDRDRVARVAGRRLSRRSWLRAICSVLMALGLMIGAASSSASTISDFPCPGCVLSVPPGYNPARPAPLLIALHGDEGNPGYISSVWDPVADQLGALVLSPECPKVLGCPGSWWGWLESGTYDDAWLGDQVDQVEAHYHVDRTREYLTGWSGGADFLGWFALAHADRFAAAAFVVGGVPYYQTCPVNPLPAYFLMGSKDFRYASGQPAQVQAILNACGDPTQLTVLPGQDHSGTIAALSSQNYATSLLNWLEQYARGAASADSVSSPSPSVPTIATGPAARALPPGRHKRSHKHRKHRARRHRTGYHRVGRG
ncbi:MAG: hypothetical protein JO286_16300 [Solirubrobacterales bacterium]|nr:hypothetical protein [Solirubrobacterales bacterium]